MNPLRPRTTFSAKIAETCRNVHNGQNKILLFSFFFLMTYYEFIDNSLFFTFNIFLKIHCLDLSFDLRFLLQAFVYSGCRAVLTSATHQVIESDSRDQTGSLTLYKIAPCGGIGMHIWPAVCHPQIQLSNKLRRLKCLYLSLRLQLTINDGSRLCGWWTNNCSDERSNPGNNRICKY